MHHNFLWPCPPSNISRIHPLLRQCTTVCTQHYSAVQVYTKYLRSSGLNLRQWWEDLGYSNTSNIIEDCKIFSVIKYLTKWRVFDNVCSRLCWGCQHQWSSFWYQPVSPTIPRLQPSPASVQVKIFLRLQDSDSDVQNRFWFSPLLSTETRIKLFVPKLNIFPLPGTFWKIL